MIHKRVEDQGCIVQLFNLVICVILYGGIIYACVWSMCWAAQFLNRHWSTIEGTIGWIVSTLPGH